MTCNVWIPWTFAALALFISAADCDTGPFAECGENSDCVAPCTEECSPYDVLYATCNENEGRCNECICDEPGTGGSGGSGGTGGTALSCATACGELACVEFSDDSFVVSDWDDAKVYATPNTYSVDQLTDDGNEAPSRFVRHTVGMNSSIWVAHTKPGADYDPGNLGSIDSIHCAFDGRALADSRQASIRPLIEQDSRWFWTPFTSDQLINENGWVHKEWRNASWEPAGHSVPLDLTADGALITFGFATGASHTTGLDQVTRDTGVDNWHVVICTEQ